MSTTNSKVTLHMVSSLDGMIAKKDNSVSWFETADHYEKGVELTEQETRDFLKTIDCYVMGSRTYEHALGLSKNYGWAYGDVPTFVLTHRNLPAERKNIEFCSGDLTKLVSDRLRPNFKNIWVAGGAVLGKEFIRQGLADDIRLSILPIILGDGIPFLQDLAKEQALHLKNVTAYKSGMVELWYEVKQKA